ncbi:MAG: M28 family peptidase, partial [Planctomycetota bacterium]
GRTVLFTAVDAATGDGDIHVYDIATGAARPLVVAPGYDGGPFFSPDGTRICYRSDRNGDNLLQLFVSDLVFDAAGIPIAIENETRLTDGMDVNWAPYWHPSGDWLVYASSRVSHRNYEVFAIPSNLNADGSLPMPVRVTEADGFDGLPVFSPDGSHMMWTGQRDAPDEDGRRSSQLYIAPISGVPEGLVLPRVASGESGLAISEALASATLAERRYHEHVTILASEWLGGRLPGTEQIEIAEHYIEHRFREAGLAPAFADSSGGASFHQPFTFAQHGTNETIAARNIGAVLPGRGRLADRWIVVGAHHDHLGTGEFGSIEGAGEVHEGADDNASGTAAVLEIARSLAESYQELPAGADARSVLFVTFSAEEMGLIGSRHFARNAPIDLESCDLMLNYDMIGRITGNRVSVSGLGSGDGLAGLLDGVIATSSLNVVTPGGLSSRSDHAAFYDAEVPVAFMTIDPFHSDYHTPADEAWKLNIRDAALAVELGSGIAFAVATHPSAIEFRQIEAYDRGPNLGVGGLKVRFGIMPGNYNDTEPGIVVQRVSPGGSAEAGGVLAGDRLMTWNGNEILSVSGWMELMSENKPGDIVTIGVIRDGRPVRLPVELQASGREN